MRLHALLQSHFRLQQPDWTSDASHGMSCDDVNCTRKHPAPPNTGGSGGVGGSGGRAAAAAPPPTVAAVSAGPASTTAAAAQATATGPAAPGLAAELRALALDLSLEAQGIASLLPPSSSISSLGALSADLAASAARLAQAAVAASSLAKAVLATAAPTAGASKPGPPSSISSVAAALPPPPMAAAVGAPALLGQPLLRSRGFAWVAGASRRDHCCEWSQAGGVVTFGTGGPWYCVLPRYVLGGGASRLALRGALVLRTVYVRAGGTLSCWARGGALVLRTAEVNCGSCVCPAVGLVLTERSSTPLGGLGQLACTRAYTQSPSLKLRPDFPDSQLDPSELSSSAAQGGVAQ